jgi:L-fucose dehydrogenase
VSAAALPRRDRGGTLAAALERANDAMDLELGGRVAVVSGGARGIGRAIVRTLVAEGARVVVADRDGGDAEADAGVVFVRGELADDATCRGAIDAALQRWGTLDVLVNNAGRNDAVGLGAGPQAFEASLRANLVHAFALASHAREPLVRARGAIVNVGSKVALTGQGGTSGYAAAKGALLALTREWAVELAPHGVRVNAVLPAEVWTPMYAQWLAGRPDPGAERARIERSIPLGARFTTPDEIAAMVVFLCSPRSSHTTGQIVCVDGGYTHLDRRATLPDA